MRLMVSSLLAAAALLAASMPMASATPAGPMSRIPSAAPLAELAQSRICRVCRNDCYRDYRIRCGYSEGCRRDFTLCMRGCWEEFCR